MRGIVNVNRVRCNLAEHLFFLARARQPGEPHQCTELENVLLPRHRLVLLAELLREVLAPRNVVRAHKVAGHLDTVGQVANLHVAISEVYERTKGSRRTWCAHPAGMNTASPGF